MHRTVAGALAAWLLAAASADANIRFSWTVSDSPTDPFSNVGNVPAQGVRNLYLWFFCANTTYSGVSAAEFDLSMPAGSALTAVAPQNGFLNAGSGTHFLLATPCINQTTLAAVLEVFDGGTGDYCIVPSAVSGKNVSVDCVVFLEWASSTAGFSNRGIPAACTDPTACNKPEVEDSSWGEVKSLYR